MQKQEQRSSSGPRQRESRRQHHGKADAVEGRVLTGWKCRVSATAPTASTVHSPSMAAAKSPCRRRTGRSGGESACVRAGVANQGTTKCSAEVLLAAGQAAAPAPAPALPSPHNSRRRRGASLVNISTAALPLTTPSGYRAWKADLQRLMQVPWPLWAQGWQRDARWPQQGLPFKARASQQQPASRLQRSLSPVKHLSRVVPQVGARGDAHRCKRAVAQPRVAAGPHQHRPRRHGGAV